MAIAQSMGDSAPFALVAVVGCSDSEPVMSLSALPAFSDLKLEVALALAAGLLSPSFSPRSEGNDMLQPAIAAAKASARKFRDAPKTVDP